MAAAIVGVPLVVLMLVWCLVPRDYYTGTDSIRTRAFVQPLPAHHTLCIRGLQLPAGTGGIQVEMLTGVTTRPAMTMTVRAGGSTFRTVLPAAYNGPTTRIKPIFPIAMRPYSPPSVAATICLTPQSGLVNLGGTADIGGPSPLVDGRPTPARLAVWFLPPAGKKRSLLSQLPQILHRLTVFRPSGLGVWFYALLLGGVLPATCVSGVWVLARSRSMSARRLGLTVYVIGFVTAAGWALMTPAFQAPDEQDHFAYAQSLAETGHPATQSPAVAPWSTDEGDAVIATRALAANEQSDGRPPWLAVDEREWARVVRLTRPSRSDGGGPTTAATHGPAYYAALIPAYDVSRSGSIWTQLTLMRLTSALLGALTVLLVFLGIRELLPRRPFVATAGALLVAFEPMFAFISGAVNNDVGINAGAACVFYLLLRSFRRGLTLWVGVALGFVIGLLPILKATGYELYPVALLCLIGLMVRNRNWRTLGGVAAVVLALLALREAWAHVAPLLVRPATPVPGSGTTTAIAGYPVFHQPGMYLSYLWQVFLPRLPFLANHFDQPWPAFNIYVERGWAAFGWYAILFPTWVYVVIVAVMLTVVPAGAIAAVRHREWIRTHWLEVGTVLLIPVVVIAAVEDAFATAGDRGIIVSEMGRYAFPAIGPLALIAVCAAFAAGRRRAVPAVAGVVTATICLSYASWLLMLQGFYT